MSKDGGEVAMLKYKSTSNRFATEHPGLREGHITYQVSSRATDPFFVAKIITRILPKITKHLILILRRYAQSQWEFLWCGKQHPYTQAQLSAAVAGSFMKAFICKTAKLKPEENVSEKTPVQETLDYATS